MLQLAFKETSCGGLKWIELAQNTVFWPSVLFKITNIICIAGPSGRSPAEIVGSNSTGGMDVCLL